MKYLFTVLVVTVFFGCKSHNQIQAEHGIENDRELMTKGITCTTPYRLVVLDSIGQSPTSPYIFYYPDKYNYCDESSFIITKLMRDAANNPYAEINFGQHRYQTLYAGSSDSIIRFKYYGYNFTILKDTILVK
jgi:hypothetical protein